MQMPGEPVRAPVQIIVAGQSEAVQHDGRLRVERPDARADSAEPRAIGSPVGG